MTITTTIGRAAKRAGIGAAALAAFGYLSLSTFLRTQGNFSTSEALYAPLEIAAHEAGINFRKTDRAPEMNQADGASDTPKKPQMENIDGLVALQTYMRSPIGRSPQNAHRNVKNNLVEILYIERTLCSGLLLTEDGWLVTAAHCLPITSGYMNFGVRINGKDYPLGVPNVDMRNDLALVKAGLQGKPIPTPLGYALEQEQLPAGASSDMIPRYVPAEPTRGQQVRMYGILNGKQYEQTGKVLEPAVHGNAEEIGRPFNNFFTTSARAVEGISGGPVVDAHTGELIGIVSARDTTDTIGSAVAKTRYLARLINTVIDIEQR